VAVSFSFQRFSVSDFAPWCPAGRRGIIYFADAAKIAVLEELIEEFYFFRLAGFAGFLAGFDSTGGGVVAIRRKPSSKLMPGNFRFNDLPMMV
jgi:hypothetical protein